MSERTVDGREPPAAYRGNQPKSTLELADWLSRAAPSTALDPAMPIVDPHHHLFGSSEDKLFYRLEDLRRDLDSGHRVIGTVYVEAYNSGWRKTGPEEMRPVGEVELITEVAEKPVSLASGECQVAAGIVCYADLRLGDRVEEVLQQQIAAAQGRLRGLRHRTQAVDGAVGRVGTNLPKPHLLLDAQFRRGVARLAPLGLSFDSWIYHTQIGELVDLADAFPDQPIVLDHVGGPIGVEEFRSRRAEVLREWESGVRALAARPNVVVKVGGMGMPLYGYGFEQRERPPTATELAAAWKPYIETSIEAFGTNRCMFESNFPVDKQSATYCDLWNAFKLVAQGYSLGERKDLFYRTACRTYRLPALEAEADRLLANSV